MKKYLAKRIILGILSAICTVALVMGILYGVMDRNLIFASDTVYSKLSGNDRIIYKYKMWEKYGYLDFEMYSSDPSESMAEAKQAEEIFITTYEAGGYEIKTLEEENDGNGVSEGKTIIAWKDNSIARIIGSYFANLISVDTVNRISGDVGERKLTFTLHDPVYGGEKFSPAIIGNGTVHKYLLYFDDRFPYLHQNFITLNLGVSFSVNQGVDIINTMTDTQGKPEAAEIVYPSGYMEMSADDLHTAIYVKGSRASLKALESRFTDDYTSVGINRNGHSRIGYSFIIGIIAVLISYILALPLSAVMATKEGRTADVLGTAFIMVMTSVPALAYIFLFKAIGAKLGLPVSFNLQEPSASMYILPVICLAVPEMANIMKWNRRFANDQMHSDYVLFARACGYTDRELIYKKIMRNAVIPIVHGIPRSVLGAFTGAIITERVYAVPGTGSLLTNAVNAYDNSVIAGLTLFYAVLSVVSVIAGDLLMTAADPRIRLTGEESVGL